MTSRFFGRTPEGLEVTEYTLSNDHGITMTVIDYGCTITSLKTPDKNGDIENIVLGFKSLQGYLENKHYTGAVIGRYANRIAGGKFSIDGIEYNLSLNQPPHHLHGGVKGVDKVIWSAHPLENEKGTGIEFRYLSRDGEEGYPGNMTIHVRYFLSHSDSLIINYLARTDAATPINLTQHSYFNLSGGKEKVTGHVLMINGDHYLPVDENKIPTGVMIKVEGTPFDFRHPEVISKAVSQKHEQIRIGQGLDHCWVLNDHSGELAHAASLYHPGNGRLIEMHTTEPGLQVYTANALHEARQTNMPFGRYRGVCLESQHFPDSPNKPQFPSTILRPGESFQSTTIFTFRAS